MAYGLS